MSKMVTDLDPARQIVAAALDMLASVSATTIAKKGEHLPSTLVDPFALRRLADLLEEYLPGSVAKVREANYRRR